MPPSSSLPALTLDQTLLLTRLYERLLLVGVSLSPMVALLYLHTFQSPALLFEQHLFHEIAIGLSMAASAFVCYVTLRCYESSGEPFLRWLTLGLLGFTALYAPHGVLTPLAHDELELFLLFGPVSRLVMAACLLRALTLYRRPSEPVAQRPGRTYWLKWLATFLAVDLLVVFIGLHADQLVIPPRPLLETAALVLTGACVVVLLRLRSSSPLMLITAIALVMFAEASIAFLWSSVWNHIWWLAHAIFASGFLLLSFGIVRAFQTTRAFATVFSQEELMRQLYAEKERAEAALKQLQQANIDLERLAATDPLTGASNRRHFMTMLSAEWARARRKGETVGLVALDIDHFKQINDNYGHHAGDEALKAFVAATQAVLRPGDVIGRIGGEEFAVVLPQTDRQEAAGIGERIRLAAENLVVTVEQRKLRFTVSVGVAVSDGDHQDATELLRRADRQLYRAKHAGRNRVAGADEDKAG